MAVVFLVVGISVLTAAAWALVGRLDADLPDVTHDLRPEERGAQPAFDVVLRGYRMDEVDTTINRLHKEIQNLKGGRT